MGPQFRLKRYRIQLTAKSGEILCASKLSASDLTNSHQFNQIYSSRWISGPKAASTHDLTFLRGGKRGQESTWNTKALYFHIPDGVKVVGDSAYDGQPDKVTTTRDAHHPVTKELFARIKSMNETANSRFKAFNVVRGPFRHGKNTNDKLKKIKYSVEAVVVLVEYDIESGHPLFEV